MRCSALAVLALLALACSSDRTGPRPDDPQLAVAATAESEGPPEPYPFGDDTYRTGDPRTTGHGTTEPGMDCAHLESGWVCNGYLTGGVDGALLDVSVLTPPGGGPHPVVVFLHGWGGSKRSSADIVERLLEDGFAVLRYSARGFGSSWGQVNLSDVHVELMDLQSIVGQVIDHAHLRLDPGAVGVTGVSYGGGQSWLAALAPEFDSPKGAAVRIRTIVPIVPWSDLLYSLIPNGRPRRSVDRPGGAKLSYVNALYFSGWRTSLDRPYENYPDYLIAWHGWINAAEPNALDPVYAQIVDGVAGYRSIWWQQQFWRTVVANRIPVLQVQGFTDDLFPLPEAKRMLLAIKSLDAGYPIASYFGDIGHPRASNKVGEFDHAIGLIRTWLRYHLKGEGSAPAYVIHAAITRPRDEPFDASNVITAATYAELANDVVSRDFAGGAALVNPLSDPLQGFYWDPLTMEAARELKPYTLPPPPSAIVDNSLAVYQVPVAELSGGTDLLIAGQPTVTLRGSTSAYRVQLNVRLFDISPAGKKELVTRGTYTLESATTGMPLGSIEVAIPTYGNLWRAGAGHMLRLEISNVDSPYITPSRVPSVTAISNVRLEVPVRR